MNSFVSTAIDRRSQFLSKDRFILVFILLALLITRGIVFPYAENLYGDSVVRSEIAERWAQEPKLYHGFNDGVYQFGPLHFYYMGIVLKAWPSREHATRLASLLMGVLLVVPIFRLGRRLFSSQAALITGLVVATWSLHIQASTTAASEAVFLTLLFFCLDYLFQGIQEERFRPLAIAALFSNLACALRYDGWMYFPLLGILIAISGKDRVASITRAVLFLALCVPFPLWWMQQNEVSMGDALYPLHYINDYHKNWVQDAIARNGNLGQRFVALFFWPATLVLTCSLAGFFALSGVVKAFIHKNNRALACIALFPAAYYTFRGALLLDFSPLARFYMVPTAIALFYIQDGFNWILSGRSKWTQRCAAIATICLCLLTPWWLGYATAWKSDRLANNLRPIAPLSTLPVDQMTAALFLKRNVSPSEVVIIDEAPDFLDINVAFFSGLPEKQLIRRRWENFEEQLDNNPKPQWLFVSSDGKLAKDGVHRPGDETINWRSLTFRRVLAASEQLFVYHRKRDFGND